VRNYFTLFIPNLHILDIVGICWGGLHIRYLHAVEK
jgi:hypothetical protein